MFLKSIGLAGFKSFAEKTELEFVPGITAVVGPNGSGKSNISDSIRWVLGEQSAKSLRGGKMEDIIFAGSDGRKAVNFGEVSLTLDNTEQRLPLDYSEVTVTRRLYRSGDSEYFINNQSCRLKDITELFMDTGIGKEAYSIIGQGRIEEILSTRSEDRRGIFEEASGIVKFKSRKKEAEKKLADTEQNILRIHDLISELDDQIEPLKLQADKAVQFKKLKHELQHHEISLYAYQIDHIHQKWKEVLQTLEALKEQEIALSTVVQSHDAQLVNERLEIRKLEEEMEHMQLSLLQVSEQFEKSEGSRGILKERKRNLVSNLQTLEETIAKEKERYELSLEQQHTLEAKRNQLSEQLREVRQQLLDEEQQLSGVIQDEAIQKEEGLKAELLDALNEAAQARNEIRYVEQQTESMLSRRDKIHGEQQRWANQQEELLHKKKNLESHLSSISGEIDEQRQYVTKTTAEFTNKQSLMEEIKGTMHKWQQQMEAMTSRRDTMKEMQDDFDGFQHGVKEILKLRERSGAASGVLGAVAELIHVPQKVEKAVETALGGALQHIVMENEALARDAITYLKKKQYGRATFLPLSTIRGRFIQQREMKAAAEQKGYVGVAVDLVQYEDMYDSVISNLLGQVIIAEKLEDANNIAASCQYRYRVVTLDGDIVNAGGSMTGGSFRKKTVSLLGRKRQIEEMEQQMEKGKQQLSLLDHKLKQLKVSTDTLSQNLNESKNDLDKKVMLEQKLKAEHQQMEKEHTYLQQQINVYEQENHMFEQELQAYEKQKIEGQQKLEQSIANEAALQQKLSQAEEERKQNETAKEALQVTLTDLKVKTATLKQEKQAVKEQWEQVVKENEVLQQSVLQHTTTLDQWKSELTQIETTKVGQTEQINQLKLSKEKLTESLELKRSNRAACMEKVETEEAKTKVERTELKKMEDHIHQTEVKANRLDVELENLLQKLQEDYEISFEMAKAKYPMPDDVIALQHVVKELKRNISDLGEVNIGAIEEYERIHERYQFLSSQKSDLDEAKQKLYDVIKEMEAEMSLRFTSTFEQIRKHFIVVFAKLFGGGKADLILEEPNELLQTGIEIVAQPPGKKLQNLQLLSGGERALTAIALLFAILNVKPVPFCVLDEVEAALDEANVTRFAQYLREFSQTTQFIVVTHRKGTMEEADVLYGVTMEEGGVSKLVSVRLEEESEIA
ncbi:chromosome segregation protein SMC [Longirhabdus pacifica]|uniref:chromosome segregation protein SMC n=1 Tax=Longirhabdus pacifica TaxID=2305227 RepID=UPI0010092EA0|nr:chromosome segregation protein SMC [Longirhabdus pacifica]